MTTHGTATPQQLTRFRAAVEEIAQEIGSDPGWGAGSALERAADLPEVRAVLDRLPDGTQGALARIEREVRAFRPSPRANASTPATLAKILLLQQIDVLWWSSVAPFADDGAVTGSPELVSLAALRRQGRLAFGFRMGATGFPARLRNYAVRRWDPAREPRSSGLSHPVARPAVVGLLNEMATRFAAAAPEWRRGLWVNCIVRSVADQERLRELGYSAFLPSAHCIGWAADVEMTWLRGHGVAAPLQEILIGYRDAGVLNVIDEGQAWHVCLNPAVVSRYEDAAPADTAAVGG
ncbi:hypothetical protein [Geodermatophilus ruber]|uniref:Uncharacterized protein n=1 Tax=Geodermatophilus ruber TaxID=504800 RepID=A0A1I4INB8_9ACTN|nr:hypothetical protein [Geodermatophilus ruber]SFL55858.1 hypothetical protein SAMN04488085_11363 [Geodermatophilus ruber]